MRTLALQQGSLLSLNDEMELSVENLVAQGHAAARAGRWTQARTAFQTVLAQQRHPEVRASLAQVLWWMGDFAGTIGNLQQAYSEFRRSNCYEKAAYTAIYLSLFHVTLLGNRSAASGWHAHAARLIQRFELDSLFGLLALARSEILTDPDEIEAAAREALECTTTSEDVDVELCALSQLGYACVRQGKISKGIKLLDESMAAALSGDVQDMSTVVFASCNMMHGCTDCAEFEKAVEWIRASERFFETHGCPYLYVGCRTRYGQLLYSIGDWEQAESNLKTALQQSKEYAPGYLPTILACLAEIRMAQGRLDEAVRLLNGYETDQITAAVMACSELQKGHYSNAGAVARRRLNEVGNDQLEYSRLQEVLGEVEIHQGAASVAAQHGRELVKKGEQLRCSVIAARGYRLEGAATADPDEACKKLNTALVRFRELGMPFETAKTHLWLAHILETADSAASALEARDAYALFQQLGADGYTHRAAAQLRRLGEAATQPGPRRNGRLTRREQEILTLLGEGLSNPRIAERLFVSRKTVEHHVAHILAKLGVQNRAEAAAEAVRRSIQKQGKK